MLSQECVKVNRMSSLNVGDPVAVIPYRAAAPNAVMRLDEVSYIGRGVIHLLSGGKYFPDGQALDGTNCIVAATDEHRYVIANR